MAKNYYEWMDGFMESWKNLEGERTIEWLSTDVEYYEAPDGDPCDSIQDVAALWAVVPKNQKDITYSYDIICKDDRFCVYNWRMKRTLVTQDGELRQRIDGIFQVALNDENKCMFFKQWRSTVTE